MIMLRKIEIDKMELFVDRKFDAKNIPVLEFCGLWFKGSEFFSFN